MKKRHICLIALFILMMTLCLTILGACYNTRKMLLLHISNFASGDLDNMTVTIQTAKGDMVLTSTYAMVKEGDAFKVDYSIQAASTFTQQDNGKFSIPEGTVTTRTGSAIVEHGVVTSDTGNALDISVQRLAPLEDPQKSYFKHVKYDQISHGWRSSETIITADVVDPEGFYGVQTEDMTVEYRVLLNKDLDDYFLTLKYTDENGCANVIVYNFQIVD